jgi:hypothetical protein
MMSHLRKQHLEKKSEKNLTNQTFYKCHLCEMEYSEKFKLELHLRASHQMFELQSEDLVD